MEGWVLDGIVMTSSEDAALLLGGGTHALENVRQRDDTHGLHGLRLAPGASTRPLSA